MGLASTLLSQMEPGMEPDPGTWSFVQDLEAMAEVPAGSLDADTALRAAQFMDPGPGGPNLGAREAVAIAIGERLSEPRGNRSRFQRRGRDDQAEVRRAFYGLGRGRALVGAHTKSCVFKLLTCIF
jgi:hypothetical protein